MPVLINGGRGSSSWANIPRFDALAPQKNPRVIGPGSPNAFHNPSFETDLLGWQGAAIGWDTTTLSRVFAIPLLFTSTPVGGTNGATPTVSDGISNNWTSITRDGAATLVYSTTAPIVGPDSYVANGAGGSNRSMLSKGGLLSHDHQFVRAYWNKDTANTVNHTFLRSYLTYGSGTQGLSLKVNTSGKIELSNAANALVITSTGSIIVNSTFRTLVDVTCSTGVGRLLIWWGNTGFSLLPDEVIPFSAGANAFGATIDQWDFGICAANAVVGNVKFGGISISTVDPGPWASGEVTGATVTAVDGQWIAKVTYPTGTNNSGILYVIPAGSYSPGLKKMVKIWCYVPSGNPDVQAREYLSGSLGPINTTKDAWFELSLVITTTTSDQYIGIIDATQPGPSHTAGQFFYVDGQTNRSWPGILANPSVLENLNGWVPNYFFWDASTVTRDHTVLGHDDDWAMKIVYPTPTSAGFSGVAYYVPTEENLVMGDTYTFGIWVYVPSGNPDVAAVIPFVASGPTVSIKNAWALATVTAVISSPNPWVGVANAVFSGYSAGMFFYADDASLVDNGYVKLPDGQGFLSLL